MVTVGQLVKTKYGAGLVISRGAATPEVFVRLHSNSQIYVLKCSDVVAIESRRTDGATLDVTSRVRAADSLDHETTDSALSAGVTVPFRCLRRGQMKKRRTVQETPLAVFVTERLKELGMKQSEFCRLTGFDQGLLSKIQSSMIGKLNLETALRLAAGLSVSPKMILELIGREELHALIVTAYSNETAGIVRNQDASDDVLEITRLALGAEALGHSLTPVIEELTEMLSDENNTRYGFAVDRKGQGKF